MSRARVAWLALAAACAQGCYVATLGALVGSDAAGDGDAASDGADVVGDGDAARDAGLDASDGVTAGDVVGDDDVGDDDVGDDDAGDDDAGDDAVTCMMGMTDCGGACMTDVDCTTMGELCVGGRCAGARCAMGETLCAMVCVDLASDARNCGACGTVCAMGTRCTAGACR